MGDEQCPNCGAIFPADRAWAKRSITGLIVAPAAQDLDTRVRCPSCGTIFQATEYRYFGFVSPAAMKIGVAITLGAFVAAGLYFLFIDAR